MSVTEGYRIAEVAAMTGFTAATLRYYEEIGLTPPAARSASGYRVYRARDVDRLRFISRAKHLGCSLPEIAELVGAWEGDRCERVQQRLRERVTAKIHETKSRIADLVQLTSDLQRTSAALAGPPAAGDGPCDEGCVCMRTPAIACTLDPGEMPDRLAEWRHLLSATVRRVPLATGMRIEFGPTAPLEDVARLVAAEQACCAFFSFAITVDDRGVGLDVTAPPEGQPVVEALFGAPA